MRELDPFDPNEYRKRVLAAVEKRGGPDASDPFELYDLPPADDLDDAAVAERIEQVWAAWQRQRDHPKYRVLVELLVRRHAECSAELLDAERRRAAAARVRAQRAQRDAARYELLDAAIRRLVQRHRGVPANKVEGLYEVGALAGLSRAEVDGRLRGRRVLPAGAPPGRPVVGPERRRQVRALLDEFGRLTGDAPPPTLFALLGLGPDATAEQVATAAGAWRARARELPPERLRVVVDELLVHVAELVEPGRAAVDAYLDAVAADVAEHLRPRVRAAVLVEDRLVAQDREHLVEEALALGLDRPRAEAVLAALADELAAAADPPAPRGRGWEEPLKAARAALRAGRAVEAQRLGRVAEQHAGDDGRTPVRAVADEVATVLAAADTRWQAAVAAHRAGRWGEAVDLLDELRRTASDVPGPGGAALDELLREARAALERLPVAAPAWVSAARDARGDVLVLWAASTTPGVEYRVSRRGPDGRWQVLARTGTTSWDDGAAPVGVEVPVYAVTALHGGRTSGETRSDG
ncbi:hypothetical protein [Pseudonocardia adelaidensis]|uniref:Uncharacterized protein n=1 Tax=Pseudonocardia adelaidensis TaxID=648754 RepID=A0ABP9NNR3_9PSEU